MLTLNQVTKLYQEGQKALDNINFELTNSELVFLTGHSGAGKSTLLKVIACIERATVGEIKFQDHSISALRPSQIPFHRRQIGLIFQYPYLLPDRDVFNNVALPLVFTGASHRDMQRKVRAALDKVGLRQHEKKMPQMLSGGEQQRVSIARAIINKPKLILADEPTGNLDPELSADIMNLFIQLNHFGVGAIIASHDLNLIRPLPFRKIVLQQGRLIHIEPSPTQVEPLYETVDS